MAPTASAPSPPVQNGKLPVNKDSQIKSSGYDRAKVKQVFTFIGQLCENSGIEELASLLDENENLRKQLEDGRTAGREKNRELAHELQSREERTKFAEELEAKIKALEKQRDDERQVYAKEIKEVRTVHQHDKERADKAEDAYASQMKTVKKLQTDNGLLETKEKDANNRAAETEAESNKLRTSLREMKGYKDEIASMRSFGVTLTPIKGNTEVISDPLMEMLSSAAKSLKSLVFKDEIDFASDDRWTSFKKDQSVVGFEIPLPNSNSIVAKQMRFAVTLKVLAQVLCQQIFQPVYLSAENDWVVKELGEVGGTLTEAARKAHARSVILRLDPGQQQRLGTHRGEQAAKTAMETIELVVTEARHSELQQCLQRICADACSLWHKVQQFKEHVCSDFEFGSPSQWKALPLPGQQSPSRQGHTRQAGSSSSPSRPQTDDAASSSGDDLLCEVWPAFLVDNEPLTPGYYLQERHCDEARREEEATRKQVRKMTRNGKGSGSISKRRDSNSFLASRGS